MFNLSMQALVDVGPDLIGVFLPGAGILAKVGTFAADKAGLTEKLTHLIQKKSVLTDTLKTGLEQDHIFEQYTRVLQVLSDQHPMILVLDDLHWADTASISLLFHLGRRIQHNRILIVGTYRPDEIILGRHSAIADKMQRHPLDKILVEFKRYFGDISINLNDSAAVRGKAFVDSLLDSEPNALDEDFRKALYKQTQGNPLFTVELLNEMQTRGNILKDDAGRWVANKTLKWTSLPARVEGVIQERLGRLDEDHYESLNIASVEGETFTAEIVAQVQQTESRDLLRTLSRELVKKHQLVTGKGVERLNSGQRLSLYQFNHKLLQTYLYTNLDEVQRILAHEDIGYCLEDMFAENSEIITNQLARHFSEAGIRDKALHYFELAGDQAAAQYDYADASDFYSRALFLLNPETDTATYFPLLLKREHAYAKLGDRDRQLSDLKLLAKLVVTMDEHHPESDLSYSAKVYLRHAAYEEVTGGYQEIIRLSEMAIEAARIAQDIADEAQGFLFSGRAQWRMGDYESAKNLLMTSLHMAKQAHLQHEQAESLRNLGIVHARLGDYTEADLHLEKALHIFRELDDRQGQTSTINVQGVFAAEQGHFDRARKYFDQTLKVYREIGDRWGEGQALSNLGQVCSERCEYNETRTYLEQALRICKEIQDKEGEGVILNNLGQVANEQGDYGAALNYLEQAVEVLHEINYPRDEGIAKGNLGLVLIHLGDLELAEVYLQSGLEILKGIEDPAGQSLVLSYLGLCQLHKLDDDQARTISQNALNIAESIGDQTAEAYALLIQGHAFTELGLHIQAADAYQKALDIRQKLGQDNLATEARAGLANALLYTEENGAAFSHVNAILGSLDNGELEGVLEPLRVYTKCAQVLNAFDDKRAADIVEKADLILHRQAYRINNEAREKKFLNSLYAKNIDALKTKQKITN
jgi:predicted ATPase